VSLDFEPALEFELGGRCVLSLGSSRSAPAVCCGTPVRHTVRAACCSKGSVCQPVLDYYRTGQPRGARAEHFADDLEVSLEADMCEAFNLELEDDSAREARAPCTAQETGRTLQMPGSEPLG